MPDIQVIPGVAVISFSGVGTNTVYLSSSDAGIAILEGSSGTIFKADGNTNEMTIYSQLSATNFVIKTPDIDASGLDTLVNPLSVLTLSAGKFYASAFTAGMGSSGLPGASGLPGSEGSQGTSGLPGISGTPGSEGRQGISGTPG